MHPLAAATVLVPLASPFPLLATELLPTGAAAPSTQMLASDEVQNASI